MRKMIATGLGIAIAGVFAWPVAAQQASEPDDNYRTVLNQYCVTCHNERLKTADLLLDQADAEHPSTAPELWEKVILKLRARAMPPQGMPRPDEDFYASFQEYLETSLDRAAAANPIPGRPSERRLNRSEYANAIRDLLGVEVDTTKLLPPDEQYFGFDNNGSVLTVSPLLMERYLLTAGKVARLAIGDPEVQPAAEEYKVSADFRQDSRLNEDLPFGSRGGTAIRHTFPADGEYVVRIRLQRNSDGFIRGMVNRHMLDVRLDGSRVKLFPVGGERLGLSGPLFTRKRPGLSRRPGTAEL